MSKSTAYEFEAKPNSKGEFICESYSTVNRETAGASSGSSGFNDSEYTHQQKQYQHSYFDPRKADDVFRQSYQSNFLSGNVEYVDNMRQQFDQMRQSMLDQMESFTFIKNVKK